MFILASGPPSLGWATIIAVFFMGILAAFCAAIAHYMFATDNTSPQYDSFVILIGMLVGIIIGSILSMIVYHAFYVDYLRGIHK